MTPQNEPSRKFAITSEPSTSHRVHPTNSARLRPNHYFSEHPPRENQTNFAIAHHVPLHKSPRPSHLPRARSPSHHSPGLTLATSHSHIGTPTNPISPRASTPQLTTRPRVSPCRTHSQRGTPATPNAQPTHGPTRFYQCNYANSHRTNNTNSYLAPVCGELTTQLTHATHRATTNSAPRLTLLTTPVRRPTTEPAQICIALPAERRLTPPNNSELVSDYLRAQRASTNLPRANPREPKLQKQLLF